MKLGGVIFSLVILVAALWPDLIGATASKWVIVAVAILLLLKSLLYMNCCDVCGVALAKATKKPRAKKKKR